VYSQFHRQLMKANPPLLGPRSLASGRPGRGQPPPRRRLRGGAAYALVTDQCILTNEGVIDSLPPAPTARRIVPRDATEPIPVTPP